MRYVTCFLFAFFCCGHFLNAQQLLNECQPSATLPLEGNAVSALISTAGDLWYDGDDARYLVTTRPDSNGQTHTFANFFAGGLWMAGKDPGGSIKMAAQMYGRGGGTFDYGPGPLTEQGLQVADCANWDRLFPVTRAEVETAQDLFSGQPIDTAGIPASVLGWPAVGNPYFAAVHGFALPDRTITLGALAGTQLPLAPFFDNDRDGRYDPTRGDYPAFCGDQAIWVVFNDVVIHRQTGSAQPVQAEVRLLAYSFASPDDVLNTTTFYRYEVTNRAQEDLLDGFFGLWLDADLGCFGNDRITSVPERNLLYYHNEFSTEDPDCFSTVAVSSLNTAPAAIIQLLDASDNPRTDRDEGRLYAIANTLNFGDGFPEMYPPHQPIGYYRKLQGLWLDGSPITRGYLGFSGDGTTTRYHYDGQFTPDSIPWLMCTDDIPELSSLQNASVGPYNMKPSDTRTFTFGVTTIFGLPYDGDCPDTTPIFAAADQIKAVYDGSCTPGIVSSVGAVLSPADVGLRAYPNPAGEELNFVVPVGRQLRSVSLFAADGRLVLERALAGTAGRVSLGGSGLAAGVYVYRVATDGGVVSGRVVVR